MKQPQVHEEMLRLGHHDIWCKRIEPSVRLHEPVVVLHGGPGIPHDYLESIAFLSESGWPVVFYDQLDCGNSAKPKDPGNWRVEYFVQELSSLVAALGLSKFHILGHSWGGMLALEYAMRYPADIGKLVLMSCPASMATWAEQTRVLRDTLPEATANRIRMLEGEGRTDTAEYQEAMMKFYQAFVCRLAPWPPALQRTLEKFGENPEVYQTMCGPSEFCITGTLKDWDIRSRLGDVKSPVLVVSGRYDEATPTVIDEVCAGLSDVDRVIFANSAHMTHMEEPERFRVVVEKFLRGRANDE
jgi:proline-specific peptidase